MKKILEFPLLRQAYNYDCGATAVQSVLDYYGVDAKEQSVMEIANTKRSGTNISGLKKALRYFGLKYEEGKMNIADLKKYINKKIPVIITLQAWTDKKDVDWKNDWKDGHYVVAIGYGKNKIYFEDPSCERITFLNFKQLEERWHDIDTKNKKVRNWGMAVKRSKYSRDIHLEVSRDYKKYGKSYRYSGKKAVPMG